MTPDPIKKQLSDLDTKLSKTTGVHWAYFMAILEILREEGVLKEGRFQELADKYKKLLKDVDDHAEFLKIMRQFRKKK